MQLQEGLDAYPGAGEKHVPSEQVMWALCKDRTGEDLVLRTVNDLTEARAWVGDSKPRCRVGEMGQMAWSDSQAQPSGGFTPVLLLAPRSVCAEEENWHPGAARSRNPGSVFGCGLISLVSPGRHGG